MSNKVKQLSKALSLTPIALAVILSGCSIAPDYDQQETFETTTLVESYLYTTNENQTIDSHHWWRQFEDETLNTMIEDVQQQNIPLQVAAQRIKMAQGYQSVVESFKVPTVSVGAGYFNYQLSKNDSLMGPALNPIGDSVANLPPALGNMTLLEADHDGGFVGASIAWEVDLFNRIDHQANAAAIRVEQAQIYQNGLVTLISADLVHNYLQYRGAERRIELVKANLDDQMKTMRLIEKVVRSGYGSDLDLAQARTMLAATQSLLPQLEIAQQAHKQRLATLLGEPLSAVDIRLASDEGLPDIKGVIPVGLPSELLQRRPDIQIAEREMAAINQELAASIANRYPKFFLTGAPGVSASSFDDLFSSDSFGWVGSAGVHWNVFDGGRGEAMVDINQARFESAALGYQHSVNAAVAEVDSMLFAYGRSQENEARMQDAVLASKHAVNKAKSLYRAGLIDHLSVLDAQRQRRVIEDRQVAAKLQTAQVTVGLYKALGGDWQVSAQ